jgi:hypothetical protein
VCGSVGGKIGAWIAVFLVEKERTGMLCSAFKRGLFLAAYLLMYHVNWRCAIQLAKKARSTDYACQARPMAQEKWME